MENIFNTLTSIATASAMLLNVAITPQAQPKQTVLATRTISLENRYPDAWVNGVFKDNILYTVAYMEKGANADMNQVEKPFTYQFTLKQGDSFAFHDDIFTDYKGKVVKTTNAHFNAQEGFKFSGALYGDGVCHLASLMYWVAKDAGIKALAPTNHDFRTIPDVPREYGVSIYSMPGQLGTNSQQNLYITNTLEKPLTFKFEYDGKNLTLSMEANPS